MSMYTQQFSPRIFRADYEQAALNGGYVAPESLTQTFAKAKGLSQFRGASLWDASQAWWNDNYQQKVKAALKV
jgi:hypothetical protein